MCHIDVPVCILFEWVWYRAFLCFLGAGCLEIKLKKEQVASIECVYRGNMSLCCYLAIIVDQHLQLPTRYHFFVSNSIKLGRACSSNLFLYNVLRAKAKWLLWQYMLLMWTVNCHTSLCLPHAFVIIQLMCEHCITGVLSPPLLSAWVRGYHFSICNSLHLHMNMLLFPDFRYYTHCHCL